MRCSDRDFDSAIGVVPGDAKQVAPHGSERICFREPSLCGIARCSSLSVRIRSHGHSLRSASWWLICCEYRLCRFGRLWVKEVSAMGEMVWGYRVKGFEMRSLLLKLTSLSVLSPAGDVSFHPQAPFLSSADYHSFTHRRRVLHH